MIYTSPWVAYLTVNVESKSNEPVQDVEIVVEHLFPTLKDVDPNFRLDLVTDDYGSVLHEIYVTDPIRWSGLVQQLRLTPSKCGGIRNETGACCLEVSPADGTCVGFGLEHVFEPKEQIVSIRHQVEEAVEFMDTTARSILAYTMFGEGTDVVSFKKLFGMDWENEDACEDFYEKLDDRCYCSIPDVEVNFEDKAEDCNKTTNANEASGCDRLTTDAAGFVSISVDLRNDKTVQFGGYLGHLFEIWNITEGGAYERIAGPALRPRATFEKITKDVRIAIVDTNRSELSLSILGGHRQVEFITGQRIDVTALNNACGYNRQLVTHRGRVSPVIMPALHVAVEIPSDDNIVECRSSSAPSSESEVYPCRVPVPVPTNDGGRVACASQEHLKFTFIDQYFQRRPEAERIQDADLGVASNAHINYNYTAPFCLRTVKIGPTDKETNPLRHIIDPTKDRDWTVDEYEDLLLMDPEIKETDDIFGRACVTKDRAIFVEDDEVTLKFELVEVYPTNKDTLNCEWPWDYTARLDDPARCSLNLTAPFGTALSDVNPASQDTISITYLDGITGTDVMVDAATYVSDPPDDYDYRVFEFRPGFRINATAGEPSPFAPFVVDVTVIFNREFDGSSIAFDRSAILLGTISEDVPQTLTMTTEPTLIFSILRDPPGGT